MKQFIKQAVTTVSLAFLFAIVGVRDIPESSMTLEETATASIQKWMDEHYAIGGKFWEDPIQDGCGDPCRISENFGGHAVVFQFAARSLAKRRKHGAAIDGYCASGCALFADLARPNVCVTRSAVIAFHLASDGREPDDRNDIKGWVRDHGGFPSAASGDMTNMRYPDTLGFWPECKDLGLIIESRPG